MTHRLMVRTVMGMAAALVFVGASRADEQLATPVLAVVGSPLPTTVIGDPRHCPMKVAQVAKRSGDRVEFSLLARQPASITLTTRRGGDVCGGSLYVVPEAGLNYAARLTPGELCAAQLFRIDPHAEPPVQLLQTDNHPELNELICATQEGPDESSRLSVGRNVRNGNVRVEIGTDGYCGKFTHVSPSESGIALASGAKQWIRLKFRHTGVTSTGNGGVGHFLSACDVGLAFTPIAGAAYMIDAGGNLARCEVRLLKADATGALALTPIEPMGDSNCKPTN